MRKARDKSLRQGQNFFVRVLTLVAALVVFGYAINRCMASSSEKSLAIFPEIHSAKDIEDLLLTTRLSAEQATLTKIEKDLALLGKDLFFDQRFSSNGAVSCATCHQPDRAFTDGRATSQGIGLTSKNAPTLINSHRGKWFFHNGRADSLEMQAIGPLESPLEHGFSREEVHRILYLHYRDRYEVHFGSLTEPPESPEPKVIELIKPSPEVLSFALSTLGSVKFLKTILFEAQQKGIQPIEILSTKVSESIEISMNQVHPHSTQVVANFGRAVAAFQRTIRSEPSAYDHFVTRLTSASKDEDAFDSSFDATHNNGLKIFFGKGGCHSCHSGPLFTDGEFHNIGLSAKDDEKIDLGRSYGLLLVKKSLFNCQGPLLKATHPSESCQELEFLDTHASELVGAFKTPTLRSLSLTNPYGHDGRFSTLRDILVHYNDPTGTKPAVGHRESTVTKLNLSEKELKELEAFLKSLDSTIKSL